ncbi:hypothetical protein M1P56_14250 [Streptomyces sp. HU2014]|uniref:hypothetical protein n=1 Tax=Streptomyces sp. HU2014 TaxID=2939414 RepID=UPI002010AE89|nr:hypothetical protein [Streptomyces sp. HU2014]UQI45427.1 hypothetical protein M1P56_14250 [Streptomyces sp. HU2014]
MNEEFAKKLRDAAIATGIPMPEREHYEVTVSNQSAHALVLTSKVVSGSFDEAPDEGHVLRPRESDTFRVTSVHFPWESGAAAVRYRMTDAPVTLTATGGPSGSRVSGGELAGPGCEHYDCAVGTCRGGNSLIMLEAAMDPHMMGM